MKLRDNEEVMHDLRPGTGLIGVWLFTQVVIETEDPTESINLLVRDSKDAIHT
ncbi:MAG: hypothetical protein AAFU65_07445 [Pseudomonadota bacterium]